METLVITAARRTPIGTFMGSLSDVSAADLGVAAAKAVLDGVQQDDVADVIVGNVLQAGQGMNVARQVALKAGLADHVPGLTVNRVCGSGLQAVISAVQGLRAGDGKLYLAGGTESMSRAPYLLPGARKGYRLGNAEVLDSMLVDGLTDVFNDYHMGMTAENIAAQWNLTREEQDAFALESQQRAARAIESGHFRDEIVPVEVPGKKGPTVFDRDEHPRATSPEALAKLRPAFKKDGTVTAGNASGLNDGAAMLTVTTEEYARANGLPVLAEIASYAAIGVDPKIMGIGPAKAVPIALKKAGMSVADVDLLELNEAFAAQSLAVVRDLGADPAKVNVTGGAIALGHPIGASGARVLVTLIHALRREGKETGVASLCIGGGMGIAMVVRAR
ncbi:acetyl-CoA C-acetyltransferase [Deinococcus metallilatus]|uniref:Acetyl-CoA C-acetyltransferase n=1 Tax=Deinococcus metallilatus TaxID=1211322 RepID=A0AAJ5K397_9DEIO|nr:acetyl-CoA C-acetyltransferase [Deinococcus metallilatus]MBB5297239.1 acetyl-CoA C-acetyltransferase [Deinococcus metallilatus]QBY09657.1 acetyl-CoA C-acetyltransferase [Deinococcus metallilatus]RXJ09029.1 acetyl-CoA C-acetyltransferase [Deinococcus metallilatus]TLK21284.1 acetyl-CoA C-acetyltransferase [Deinococcus metallilatus]GMA17182.1 acetyl-CoA acetyltransferase [Deinococcus metallilatus]